MESFPLHWPLGRKRTESWARKNATFKTSPGKARDELLYQLKKLGARDIVISSNVATYKRAGQEIMYADQRAAGDDPGVAVYYTWNGEQYSLACDKWKYWPDNLHSLNKTVEAIRGIERWGSGEMVKAAFVGFKALPEATKGKTCWDVLDIQPTRNEDLIKSMYRSKAQSAHPDRGGSTEKFQELNNAYDAAIRYARS